MEQLVYTYETASARGSEAHLGGQFANLKVLAGQTLEFVNREAQQVMGGLGYSRGGRGARIEQISRDLRVMVVGGGSEEILADLAVAQEVRALEIVVDLSMIKTLCVKTCVHRGRRSLIGLKNNVNSKRAVKSAMLNVGLCAF